MATLRLRPLIHPSSGMILGPRACCGCSTFSTISLRQLHHPTPASTSSRFLPRFLDPSIYWKGPRPAQKKSPQGPKSWNPATFYIAIFLLIGSQAIQMIALRHEHDEYMRRANNKIEVLKEVIDKLHKGDDVDVEEMLGVGDEKEEKSWEDVLREIEEEDATWQSKARKKQKQKQSSDGSASENSASVEVGQPNAAKQEAVRVTRQPQSAQDYRLS